MTQPASGIANIYGHLVATNLTDTFSTPSTIGLGSEDARWVQAGLHNADFRLEPPDANSIIDDDANPLPYWHWSAQSGGGISARSIAHGSTASGRAIRMEMREWENTVDDATLDQYVPVIGSLWEDTTYLLMAAGSVPSTGDASWYLSGQYVTNSLATVGSDIDTSVWSVALGGEGTGTGIFSVKGVPNTASGNSGAVPSTAAYLRVRLGMRRGSVGSSTLGVADWTDVRLVRGSGSDLILGPTAAAGGGTAGALSALSSLNAGILQLRGVATDGTESMIQIDGPQKAIYLSPGVNGSVQLGDSGDAVFLPGGTVFPGGTGGSLQWDDRQYVASQNATPRRIVVGEIGFAPFALPPSLYHGANSTTDITLATSGGSIAVPVDVAAHMLVQSLTIRQGMSASARTAEFRLYEDRMNTTTADFITALSGSYSFTPAAATASTANVSTSGTYIGPGSYWLVIRNTSASQTFVLRGVAAGELAGNVARTKTVGSSLAATLDLSTGWSGTNVLPVLRLDGRVVGESSAF